jgi:hypothetical protein
VDQDEWTSLKTKLPVDLYGVNSTSAETQPRLKAAFPHIAPRQIASADASFVPSSGKRVVLYINPAAPPSPTGLCSPQNVVRELPQSGQLASVTAALCDGDTVVSYATGKVLLSSTSEIQLRRNLGVVISELFDILQPGADDPSRYYN